MSSLTDLIQQSDCLEKGQKGDISASVGISQISTFFSRIAVGEDLSIDGRFFLAQQGIDCAKIEQLIDSINDESAQIGLSNNEKHKIPSRNRPLSAIERFQNSRNSIFEEEWRSIADSTLSSVSKIEPFNKVDNYQTPFDPNSAEFCFYQKKAYEYAKGMKSLSSLQSIIDDSLNVLKKITIPDSPSSKMQIAIFEAFKFIFDQKPFENVGDFEHIIHDPHYINIMIRGSIRFLQKQFCLENGLIDCSFEKLDQFVQTFYPDIMAPWPHIWIALRAGLYDLISQICQQHQRTTKSFFELFNQYIINDSNEPSPELRIRVASETSISSEEDRLRSQSLSFAVAQEFQIHDSIVKTAEDYVFCMIYPFRFISEKYGGTSDLGSLYEVQALIREESSRLFANGDMKFLYPLLMVIALDFEHCGDALVQIRAFPTETVHLCLALKAGKLWDSNAFPSLLYDFVKIFPISIASRAIDYLSFIPERSWMIKYLLSLDVESTMINLEGNNFALSLISEETDNNPFAVSSLYILILCCDYHSSIDILIGMGDEINNYTPSDLQSVSHLSSVLMKRISQEFVQPQRFIRFQHAICMINIAALSYSHLLSQSARKVLLEDSSIVLSIIDNSIPMVSRNIKLFQMLHSLSSVLVNIESGMYHDAISIALGIDDIRITNHETMNIISSFLENPTITEEIMYFVRTSLHSSFDYIVNNEDSFSSMLTGIHYINKEAIASMISEVIISLLICIKQKGSPNDASISMLISFLIQK